jgi:anti-sigma factor RsiW
MMACQDLVELVTEYLEGSMDAATVRAFEAHLTECDGCVTYLEQMRATLRALGSLPVETIAPTTRDNLLAAFRNWSAGNTHDT